MNGYLIQIGGKLPEVRRLLGWTQEVLAQQIGVSRPTIVNIEKDPTKMSKTIALAVFAVVLAEIQIRISSLGKLDFQSWKNVNLREQLIGQIKNTSGLNSQLIATAFSSMKSKIQFSGAIGAVTGLFAKPANAADDAVTDVEEIKNIVNETIVSIKMKLEECFGMDTLNIEIFVKKIRESEME